MSNAHREFWDNSKSTWKSRLNSRDVTLQEPGDLRDERKHIGLVSFKPDRVVTDTRGPGWRTRQGHMVKNQAFYRTGTGEAQNVWNDPIHAGTRTWKYWHGPRLRTDAPLMEKLDQQDDEQERLKFHMLNTNARRVDNLGRMRMQREQNYQFARSASWAPNHRAVEERLGHGPANTSQDYNDLNTLPQKALKQVLTKSVLDKDTTAIEYIAKRLQQEEDYKTMYQNWKKHRRNDTLQAISHQRSYNDTLEQIAGQPPRAQAGRFTKPMLSRRMDRLSQAKKQYVPPDITRFPDFRGLVHADSQLALEKLFPVSSTGHGAEPRWHDGRTVDPKAPAHALLRTDHVNISPRSQSVPPDGLARAPPPPHVYEEYTEPVQYYPRPHTDDVDPQRYKYRVLTPPPTQTYTYTVDVPSAAATRKGAAQRWEQSSTQLRTGSVEPGDQPVDWRQASGPPHAGEQPFRPSVSGTAPQDSQNSAYVAPRGRMRVGRGMSHELLHGDESKTFVTHKGFTHGRAGTRDMPLQPLQPLERQPNPVERSFSAPSLESLPTSFKKTVGFSHHKSGFVQPPTTTADIASDLLIDEDYKPICDDPRFGNFALRPARPTCLLTTRPRIPSRGTGALDQMDQMSEPGSDRGMSPSLTPETMGQADFY